MSIKVIVTDVDGTLTRAGEGAKEDARDILFSRHTGAFQTAARRAWDEAISRGGNRHDAIRSAFAKDGRFPREEIEGIGAVYGDRYGEIAETLVVAGGVYPETTQALREWSGASPIYAVSVMPQTALERVLERLGLTSFFKASYGAPRSKADSLREIVAREKVSPAEVLLIGDGRTDERAASEIGCRFIGVTTEHNQWEHKPFPLIKRLTEVAAVIERKQW